MSLIKPIPEGMREEMHKMPYYHTCARKEALDDHICQPCPVRGKLIEWEHAMTYAGTRINEIWAIVPICWYTHRGPGFKKEINEWLALNRITDDEILARFGKTDWIKKKAYLNKKYGAPKLSTRKPPF